MNDRGFKYRSSSYNVPGKEYIIVIVVISTALSFTLGYFVGKSVGNKELRPSSHITEITPLPPEQESPASDPEETDSMLQKYSEAKHPENAFTEEDIAVEAEREIAKKDISSNSAVSAQKSQEIIYTVQLGAFKIYSDAENFKTKYAQKGYKTYISTTRNINNEKIYKVRTGKFKERKDAEILSVKLKKIEGLSPFVTFKDK